MLFSVGTGGRYYRLSVIAGHHLQEYKQTCVVSVMIVNTIICMHCLYNVVIVVVVENKFQFKNKKCTP